MACLFRNLSCSTNLTNSKAMLCWKRASLNFVETNSQIRDLDAAVKTANSPPQRRRNFQKLFDTVVTMWVNGELAS